MLQAHVNRVLGCDAKQVQGCSHFLCLSSSHFVMHQEEVKVRNTVMVSDRYRVDKRGWGRDSLQRIKAAGAEERCCSLVLRSCPGIFFPLSKLIFPIWKQVWGIERSVSILPLHSCQSHCSTFALRTVDGNPTGQMEIQAMRRPLINWINLSTGRRTVRGWVTVRENKLDKGQTWLLFQAMLPACCAYGKCTARNGIGTQSWI